jgi:hypothetical protein
MPCGTMSASGQNASFGSLAMTSGLPSEADFATVGWHVSKVPTGDMGKYLLMHEAIN